MFLLIFQICKQHPGFLRLAIGDPRLDSKGQLMRVAWATYRWDVNIKQIYWALRDSKVKNFLDYIRKWFSFTDKWYEFGCIH